MSKQVSKILVAGFFVLTLCNLVYIPVAWVDEVMDLDPAMRFVLGKGYSSYLWQYEGTEKLFLANLPLRNLPFVISGFLFGADIFWMRLPHLLFFAGVCFFLWKVLRHFSNSVTAWVLLLFFMFDKGIYESLRSVRCEMLQLFLLSGAVYFSTVRVKWIGVVVLSSLLALTHPASWALSVLLAANAVYRLSGMRERAGAVLLFLFPVFAWLAFTGFDFDGIHKQLFQAGADHRAEKGGIGLLLKNHLYGRFSHYIKIQPWEWLAVLAAHGLACRSVFLSLRKRQIPDLAEILLLGHSLFWLFVLAPHYRYNPTLLFLVFVILAKNFPEIKQQPQWVKRLVLVLFLVHLLPFTGVNFLGLTQRNERNPYKAQEWLEQHVPQKSNTLICGESIAAYWVYNKPKEGISYCAANYPHKFDFESYSHLLILT